MNTEETTMNTNETTMNTNETIVNTEETTMNTNKTIANTEETTMNTNLSKLLRKSISKSKEKLQHSPSKVTRNIKVPTGNILIVDGDHGQLECLSIGDYGKEANLKAEFLGLNRPIEHVSHQDMLPLEEKWVVTISTQYGCSMNCVFCDVPSVGKGRNATMNDLRGQVDSCLALHKEVTHTDRLNIHFARMGEPTWNLNVLEYSRELALGVNGLSAESKIHPVISTMMPKNNRHLELFLGTWMYIKNELFMGDAGLQFSINSTSDEERAIMFSGNSLSLAEISRIGKELPTPKGRKITLNFAIAGYEIDANKLVSLFDPNKFLVKLTPMHKTERAVDNGIETDGEYTSMYPYLHVEEELKAVGFDVIVFIASEYEDMGRITCGNAILSGTEPECEFEDILV